ncbi:XRE family transcriptional regulator [Providencia rustigianii]
MVINMQKNISRIVGARIRTLRKDRRMSIQQLSKKLGISQQHQSRHELGDMRIHVDTIYSISEILELDINELISDFTSSNSNIITNDKRDREKILQAEILLSPEQNFSLYK